MKTLPVIMIFAVAIILTSATPSQHTRRAAIRSVSGVHTDVVLRSELAEEPILNEVYRGEECENSYPPQMGLYKMFGRNSAKCNDGTDAGYYLLRQPTSTKWVIFLQGGWYCSTEKLCKLRMQQNPDLTGSSLWDNCKIGSGIISTISSSNPYLWDSNMVYIPYCSSDVWAGTVRNRIMGDVALNFMGSIIIEQVVQRLIHSHGMMEATSVLMAGTSAGGTGILMNIDRVQRLLRTAESGAVVRGVVDSAWYLERPEMERDDNYCYGTRLCSAVAKLKRGVHLWKPRMPASCINEHRNDNTVTPINSARRSSSFRTKSWKCFFSHVVYPHVHADVFVVQMLFDPLQFMSDRVDLWNFSGPVKTLQKYIKNLYMNVNETLKPVEGVFASSCVTHSTLESRHWRSIAISHISLPDALQCWILKRSDENELETMQRDTHPHTDMYEAINDTNDAAGTGDENPYSDYYYDDESFRIIESEPKTSLDRETCDERLIDPCSLPHCNPTCPTLYHPDDYRQINAVELNRKYLGIDLGSMAKGFNMSTEQLFRRLSEV